MKQIKHCKKIIPRRMKKMQNELANPSVDSHDNCYVESLVVHFAKA